MTKTITKRFNVFLFLTITILGILIILSQITMHLDTNRISLNYKYLNSFSIIFLSIILDAFPFIMIGVLISSVIQVFVSEEMIARIIPKNKILGLFLASTIGLVFPVCDCAVIPVARRFLKKGVSLDICLTFILAVPIINPISIMATYYAFANKPIVPVLRIGFGIVTAILIGYIMGNIEDIKEPLKKYVNEHTNDHKGHRNCHKETCACGHVHHHEHHKEKPFGKILDILDHISIELYDVGKYLIFGALLSSLMQTFITRQYAASIAENPILSIFVMGMLAFALSICSTADVFIAKTFLGQFTTGSIVTFLIMGPMLDIKNTLMLSETFKLKFLLKLMLWIIMMTFTIGMIVNIFRF